MGKAVNRYRLHEFCMINRGYGGNRNNDIILGGYTMVISLSDNGGRRLEGDRRLLMDMNYSPERRSGLDRRASGDRRSKAGQLEPKKERRVIYDLLSA